jgi:membrane protein required for beta-lactamase induction
MSLLALVFALLCERGLTHLLHLRELRWLDPLFDHADRALGGRTGLVPIVTAIALLTLAAAPVAFVSRQLGPQLLHLLQFTFAVIVLLLSFGPRDLKDEVDDYVSALERHDRDEATRRAKELLESTPPARGGANAREAVEEAIFVQANNRIFGVMFWFMVLGPAGAWLYRVSDLLRRRATFEAARQGVPRVRGDLGSVLTDLHGALAWLPARLAAFSYALAGSFEDAVGNWKIAVDSAGAGLLDRAEGLLARVGRSSLQPSLAGVAVEALDHATASGAWRLVSRAIWVWLAVIAVLVIAGTDAW